jgi:hypothetical protein
MKTNGAQSGPEFLEPGTATEATGLGPSETQKRVVGGRPLWVFVVTGLYALALFGAVGVLVFHASDQKDDGLVAAVVLIAIVVLSQAGLLLVPVRIALRRPIRRGSLWLPLVTSGLLFGLLVLALGWVAMGLLSERAPDRLIPVVLRTFAALAVASWIVWVIAFYRMSASRHPEGIGLALHKWLLKGSVLELLIAVPAHIVERQRDLCSASVATFLGVCTGISVMFLAFGPAVAVLYVRRCMNLQPASANTLSPEAQKRRVLVWSILAGLAAALFLFLILWVGLSPETKGWLRQ